MATSGSSSNARSVDRAWATLGVREDFSEGLAWGSIPCAARSVASRTARLSSAPADKRRRGVCPEPAGPIFTAKATNTSLRARVTHAT